MELVKNWTLGSDVEYFVGFEDGTLASAEGYIPGTKEKPEKFVKGDPFFATQLDNVLAEGNIPPTKDIMTFIAHMARLRAHMDSLLLPHKLQTVARAAAHLDKQYLQTENAKVFGCDPSYNCWTREQEHVKAAASSTLRTAGFHIHIGYDNPSPEVNLVLARMMDAGIGLTAVAYEDKSERRSMGYGKAGNFRNQNHGVEYRTLSSFWAADKARIQWVLTGVHGILNRVNQDTVFNVIRELTAAGDDIQDAINSDNKKKAASLVSKLKMMGIYMNTYMPQQFAPSAAASGFYPYRSNW